MNYRLSDLNNYIFTMKAFTDKNLKRCTFLKIQLVYKLLVLKQKRGKYNSIFYFHKQSKKCMS